MGKGRKVKSQSPRIVPARQEVSRHVQSVRARHERAYSEMRAGPLTRRDLEEWAQKAQIPAEMIEDMEYLYLIVREGAFRIGNCKNVQLLLRVMNEEDSRTTSVVDFCIAPNAEYLAGLIAEHLKFGRYEWNKLTPPQVDLIRYWFRNGVPSTS